MKNYKNIEVEIDNLSDSQKSDLKLAEKLLGFMNSIIGSVTQLTYKGQNFNPKIHGYDSLWIMHHISNFINMSIEDYKNFALNELNSTLKDSDKQSIQVYLDRNVKFHTKHLASIEDSEGTLSDVLRSLIYSLNSSSSELSSL